MEACSVDAASNDTLSCYQWQTKSFKPRLAVIFFRFIVTSTFTMNFRCCIDERSAEVVTKEPFLKINKKNKTTVALFTKNLQVLRKIST